MNDKQINISRYRNAEYIVNYNMNGRIVSYRWAGSKGNKIDTKPIPEYVVDWLSMDTTAFTDGDLVIEKNKDTEEIINNIDNKESYESNIHTRDEIIKILKGNMNTMKSKLNQITNKSEKDFVIDVAKEINIDSSSKRKFLANWIGVDLEMLFED